MPKQSSEDKALGYLTQGRVCVRDVSSDGISATVRGSDPEPYLVTFTRLLGWACDCPARVSACAHVMAVQLVTDSHQLPEPVGPQPTRDDPFAGLV
jgi:uncharacterized Zn finger protein